MRRARALCISLRWIEPIRPDRSDSPDPPIVLEEKRTRTAHGAPRTAHGPSPLVEALKLTAREQRRTWRIATALRDIKFGLRVLRRNPGFAVAAVLTLALGVGANVAVFSVVRAVLIEELAFPDARRVLSVAKTYEAMQPHDMTVEEIATLGRSAPALQVISGSTSGMVPVRGDADTERSRVEQVLPRFFDVFGVTPAVGRTLGAPDFAPDARAAVISDGLWRRQFNARPDLSALRLHVGGETFGVVGVMPADFFPNPSTFIEADLWIPAPMSLREPLRGMRAIARVAPGRSIEDAAAQVTAVIDQNRPADLEFSDRVRRYLGMAVAPLGATEIDAVRPGLLMLQGISLFLLFITCANLANVFLAHAAARSRELGVRSALGAGRARLVGQMLTEASVIAVTGALLGLAIAAVAVPALTALAVNVLPRNAPVAIDGPELGVALVTALLASLVFAGVPAWLSSRSDPVTTLRGTINATAAPGARLLQASLVGTQIVLALVVLTGAALLIQSFARVASQPLGFDPRGLMTGEVVLPTSAATWREDARLFSRRLTDGLRARLGSRDVFVVEDMPYNSTSSSNEFAFIASGDLAPLRVEMADIRTTQPGALEFLGVALRQGRAFAEADGAGAPPVALVNEAFVRRFAAGRDVIGGRVEVSRGSRPGRTIVGVVADTRPRAQSVAGRPAVYEPAEQAPSYRLTMAVRGYPLAKAAAAMREAVKALDPTLPVTSIGSVEDKVGSAERRRTFYLSMLSLFAALAVALAAVGIYGVVAHATERRGREMGIRLALGAKPRGLVRMVVRQSLTPVGFGLAGGIVAAWWTAKLMQSNPVFKSQLFQITAHDPATFIAVPCVLFVVAVTACWIPARRAAGANVTDVMRAE